MDQGAFDTLARLVSAKQSRRAAASLVVAIIAGHNVTRVVGKDRRKGKTQARSKEKAKAKPCYSGSRCSPGKGRIASGCDFSGSTAFVQGDFRGANLSYSSFRGADLRRADFRGANLSGACLVDADLTRARLGGANQGGAIRCRTKTDAGIDNSNCDRGTACCPTELGAPQPCTGPLDCSSVPVEACRLVKCTNGQCVYTADCSPGCCDANGHCQQGFNDNEACGGPGGTCQVCTGQEQCQSSPGQPLPSWSCVCVPNTCADLGRECGTTPDGCGGMLQCGTCSPGNTPICNNGKCSATCPGDLCTWRFNAPDGTAVCGPHNGFMYNCYLVPEFGCMSDDDCPPWTPTCIASIVAEGETIALSDFCDHPPSQGGMCGIVLTQLCDPAVQENRRARAAK